MISIKANIAPHLVPFLLEELDTREIRDGDGTLCQVAYLTERSSLAQFINACRQESRIQKSYSITLYGDSSEDREYFLTDEGTQALNLLLEDIMRSALVFFVKGYVKGSNDDKCVRKAVEEFLQQYDLYDYEHGKEQLRQVYYRSIRKGSLLKRFQDHARGRRIDSSGGYVTARVK